MKDTLNMPPHERIKLLRKGEQVLCKKCRKGIMRPVGDYEKTNTFSCDYCKSQLIIDWVKAADVNKCLPLACFTTVPDSTLVALLGKVLVHWIQTAAVAPAQFMYTRTRARRSYITRYARIIGFSGSAGLSSPSGNGATNTRTGRPEPPCSTTFPRMIPVQHWSNRALKSYVLALMGAIRQYQSHTAGTCLNPTLRRLYSLPTLSRNETVENETNTANVASESERSEAIRKPRMRRNAQSRKY